MKNRFKTTRATGLRSLTSLMTLAVVLTATANVSADSAKARVRPPAPAPAPAPAPSPSVSGLVGALAVADTTGSPVCGISSDGTLLALHPINNLNPVVVKNLLTGVVRNASASGDSRCKEMTPDGRFVLMDTPSGVVLRDFATGVLEQVSPPTNSIPNNAGFSAGSISDDGSKVAFVTIPTQNYIGAYNWINTVPARIMVRDRATGITTTLPTDNGSVAQGEIVLGHLNARLSPDGSRIAFVSTSSSLVAGDTNQLPDVFVRELASGVTSLASSGASGAAPTGNVAYYKVEWANNDLLQFSTEGAGSLGPRGEYVKDVETGTLALLLSSTQGDNAVLSFDARKLIFSQQYSGFDRRVIVRDLTTNVDRIVSSSATGVASNGNSNVGALSRDGKTLAFTSNASNLFSPTPAVAYRTYAKTVTTP